MKIANVLISDSWGDVTPEAFNRGIGGREGALIYLSKEWAKRGHEVTSFVNVEEAARFKEFVPFNPHGHHNVKENTPPFFKSPVGYHEYVPLGITNPVLGNFEWDVVIAWECPSVFNNKAIRDRAKLKVCEMQVCHLGDDQMAAAEKHIDLMAVLSPWHRDFVMHSGLKIPLEQYRVFPNGVDLTRYPSLQTQLKLKKKIGKAPKFVYSSSPDRGLWYLLQIWPYLREEFPEAELKICYGTKKYTERLKWAHGRHGEMSIDIEILLEQPGVEDLGKIGQDVLAKLQLEADAWIYPFDPQSPTESGCITAVEAAASACPIITTDADCMADEFGQIGNIIKLPFNKEEFAAKTIEILHDEDLMEYQRVLGLEFAQSRQWGVISESWLQTFSDPN